MIGNDTKTNFAMSRRKREVATPVGRRVVKKLVRVEPVNVAQASEKAVKRVRPRKRLVIKKKKKRLLSSPVKPLRRTVVVTKKRLVTKTSEVLKSEDVTAVVTPEITDETTTPFMDVLDESTTVMDEMEREEILTTTEKEQSTTPLLVENILEDDDETTTEVYQNVPDYEPSFPELSLDDPVLVLKTTVLSSIELQTKTVVQSRLRTYTFLITRVNGDEQIVTSTTEVKPHTKTIVVTEPLTRYTTLTLLNLDPTDTLPITDNPVDPSSQRNSEIRGESRSCCTFLLKNFVQTL